MKKITCIISVLVVLLIAALGIGYMGYKWMIAPIDTSTETVYIYVYPTDNAQSIKHKISSALDAEQASLPGFKEKKRNYHYEKHIKPGK
jgi:hypothetical protein